VHFHCPGTAAPRRARALTDPVFQFTGGHHVDHFPSPARRTHTVPRPAQTDRPAPSVTLRARVAAHRRSLTGALSEGASPASSPELALRAEQLTSDRTRRALARSLRRTVHEARHPVPRRIAFGLVRRSAVLDAADAIDVLVKRLRSPEPIAAKGRR
jgi:hypothetical protein